MGGIEHLQPHQYIWGVLALAFLIVVHEGGHFWVARWCGMRIERFSLGFGPGILKRRSRKTGTIFQLAPLPFGGFVEIRGMNLAEEVDPEDMTAYPNRPVWQRFLAILAGPATNYLAAVVIAFFVYNCHGIELTTWHVDSVDPGFDAVGKLQPGDSIIAVDHVKLVDNSSVALRTEVTARGGKPVIITVLRDDPAREDADGEPVRNPVDVTIQPKPGVNDDGTPMMVDDNHPQQMMRLGLKQSPDIMQVSALDAAGRAAWFPIDTSGKILDGFYKIITRQEPAQVSGAGGIVKAFGEAFGISFVDGLKLVMALSVYLGLFNLLPLPALDGGRLAFLTYEMITRRRANQKIENTVHMTGIMILFVVLILVTLHDCHAF